MSEKHQQRRESLRCLLAALASVEAMEWVFIERGIDWATVNLNSIDRRLQNIRAFFMRGVLDDREIQRNHMPMFGPFLDHLMSVLFADAVRWWAAAHRSRQDENKFLRGTMYKGDLVPLFNHFNHEFRNNQLAHFPGGKKSNDHAFWVPTPYGFPLTVKECEDFKRLLSNGIAFTLGAYTDTVNLSQMAELNHELKELVDQLTEEEKSALDSALAFALADLQSNSDLAEKRLKNFREFLQQHHRPQPI